MALFAVTFRLHEGSDYSTRWQSVVDAVKQETAKDPWEEPTSFFLFNSAKLAKKLCDDIYHKAKIYEDRDLILVINLSLKEYAQRGAKYPATLDALMASR